MSKFRTKFSAIMVPRIVQSTPPECNFASVGAAFTSPVAYGLQGIIHGGGLEGIVHGGGGLAAPIAQIYAIVTIKNSDGTLNWKLQTKPTALSGSSIKLTLDPKLSQLNGANNQGTMTLTFVPEGLIDYAVDALLTSEPKNMPFNNGGEKLDIRTDVYINNRLTFTQDYPNSLLNTLFLTEGVSEFVFTYSSLSYKGNIVIENFTKPVGASALLGTIQFKNKDIKSDWTIEANISKQGNVIGTITPASSINSSTAVSYVNGAWGCNLLELNFDLGAILGECEFLIPTYTKNIAGVLELKAK